MNVQHPSDENPRRFVPADDVVALFHEAPSISRHRFRDDLDAIEPVEPHPEATDEE